MRDEVDAYTEMMSTSKKQIQDFQEQILSHKSKTSEDLMKEVQKLTSKIDGVSSIFNDKEMNIQLLKGIHLLSILGNIDAQRKSIDKVYESFERQKHEQAKTDSNFTSLWNRKIPQSVCKVQRYFLSVQSKAQFNWNYIFEA